MRFTILTLFIFLAPARQILAQDEKITPQVLQKIKTEVEKNVQVFRQSLVSEGAMPVQVEFSTDTFRLERIVEKRMDIDFTTVGMNITVMEMADGYDKIMNRFYNRLLKILKPADKKTLVSAQKAWLAFRNAEEKLIWTMSKQEYSGGGSIQSNIATASFADIIVKRTIGIYNYYSGVNGE